MHRGGASGFIFTVFYHGCIAITVTETLEPKNNRISNDGELSRPNSFRMMHAVMAATNHGRNRTRCSPSLIFESRCSFCRILHPPADHPTTLHRMDRPGIFVLGPHPRDPVSGFVRSSRISIIRCPVTITAVRRPHARQVRVAGKRIGASHWPHYRRCHCKINRFLPGPATETEILDGFEIGRTATLLPRPFSGTSIR